MTDRDGRAALLGDDLWALAGGVPAGLIEVVPLTTLPSPQSDRASFRLRFADGRILKGCRFEFEGDVRRVAALLPLLDPRFFPRLVASRGAAALLEWADGEPLRAEQCQEGLMEELGALHARLHDVAPPTLAGEEGSGTAGWPGRLARYLDELVALASIDQATRDRARALAWTGVPRRFPRGLVHKDFCRENMVVSRDGRVQVVDNETLAADCSDYDLARTWHRWPMESRQAEDYLRGYRRHRSVRTLERDFPFWAVAVLAESALFRLRRGIEAAALPLARLRALLARYEASGLRPAFVEPRVMGHGPGTSR